MPAIEDPRFERSSPQQMDWLLSLLEKCGVMPRDLATMCALKYKSPFYKLSYADAENLLNHLAALGPNQNRVRQWISDQVQLYTSGAYGDFDA